MTNANELYRYHVWGNDKVLRHLGELPEDILHRELQSVFPSVGETLSHVYVVDNLWLSAMAGDSLEAIRASLPSLQDEVKGASLDTFQARFSEVVDRFHVFFERQPDLEAWSEYPHPRFGPLRARYSDIVQHIVNHGTYHRGNITAMLRQMGFAGVATDYVFYLYSLAR